IVWLLVTGPFVVGTICSEYTRGLLLRFAGVQLPPRSSPVLPRPGSPARVRTATGSTAAAHGSPVKIALPVAGPKQRLVGRGRSQEVQERQRPAIAKPPRDSSPRRYVSTHDSSRSRYSAAPNERY